MSTEIAARLEGVIKRYGPVTALDGAGFPLRRGETVALLGPNGAGKTTSVGILLGLLRPDAGRVELFGGSPHQATTAGRVVAMLQQGDLLDGVTVAELVGLVRDLYPAPPLEETLGLAGLTELAGRRVERLSGGQVQRVRYALAITGAPELLFLDEPTVGMDVQARRAFWRGVRDLADRGTSILFAIHYLEEADDNADRIVVLVGGKVVADGPVTQIKAGIGSRHVRATVAAGHDGLLRDLPGVRDLERHGESVLLESADADATVRALFASACRSATSRSAAPTWRTPSGPHRQPRRGVLMLTYLKTEILRVLRNRRYVLFALAVPVGFYLLFGKLAGGNGTVRGIGVTTFFMVSGAAYSAMLAVVFMGGAAGGRADPRLDRAAARHPAAGLGVSGHQAGRGPGPGLPAIVLVAVTAAIVGPVHLGAGAWAQMVLLLWVGVLPFAALGILAGYLLDADTAQPVTVVITIVLALLGGLWQPTATMPDTMRQIAHLLPSYHLADLGWWAVAGQAPVASDGLVLLAYTVVFAGLAAWRYRRAEARA
jgi:ABC-2 type transport system ATP-binding protein